MNTKEFNGISDLLNKVLDELLANESNKSSNESECEQTYCCDDDDEYYKCECCTGCDDNDDDDNCCEESESLNVYNPDFSILSYTDEDFKDNDKLNHYIDEMNELRKQYINCSDSSKEVIKWLLGDVDIKKFINDKVQHAIECHNKSTKQCKNIKSENTTESLATKYVEEVFKPKYETYIEKMSDKQLKSLKKSFKEFADWILEQ